MSSNIRLNRICGHCGKDFIAKTSVTQFCGDDCAKRAYKVRERQAKIEASNQETRNRRIQQIEKKEFLTVREVALLLNLSIRSVYRSIEAGTIKASNIGQRLTRIKRSDIDKIDRKPYS